MRCHYLGHEISIWRGGTFYLLVVYVTQEAWHLSLLALLLFSNMPHASSCCESMDEFVAFHQVQLLASNIPQHLWESLYTKLKLEVYTVPDRSDQTAANNLKVV